MKRIGMAAMILLLAVESPVAGMGGLGGSYPPRLTRRGEFTSPRQKTASRTSLARAIEIALLKVPGEALKAEIEVENGKALIEVRVVSSSGKVFEVEIDGGTGKVLKVEPVDDEEDEEDDDGDLSASAA